MALPGEVNYWWRQRSMLKLCENKGKWEILGKGKERACIAYAKHAEGRVIYEIVTDNV